MNSFCVERYLFFFWFFVFIRWSQECLSQTHNNFKIIISFSMKYKNTNNIICKLFNVNWMLSILLFLWNCYLIPMTHLLVVYLFISLAFLVILVSLSSLFDSCRYLNDFQNFFLLIKIFYKCWALGIVYSRLGAFSLFGIEGGETILLNNIWL